MDRYVFIHAVQAIGLILAANACANLAPCDDGGADALCRLFGAILLLMGVGMLFWVFA